MKMKKLFYWITTIIFIPAFFIALFIFHPLQMLGRVIGYQAHKNVVDAMIWMLNNLLLLSGNWINFKNLAPNLPKDKPIIVVSNHQSIYDIPAIGWVLRAYHPKYISKQSLAKGYPSISYNIRHGGSIAIDRKNQKQSAKKIINFCQYLNETKRAGVIFAEGRRAKDGQMRPFKRLGMSIMLKKMPDAVIVPVAIDGFWKIDSFNFRPVPSGNLFKCTVLPIVERDGRTNEEIMNLVELSIRKELKQPNETIAVKD